MAAASFRIISIRQPKSLDRLFHDVLKTTYYAERAILGALPHLAEAAHSRELRAAFEKHERETAGQVSRLEEVFRIIGIRPRIKRCPAIEGLIEEGQAMMSDYRGSSALDAALLSAAQAVEHYEISRYGTLRTWARELGLQKAASLLQQTLDEEVATDRALTTLAEANVNKVGHAKVA